MDYEHGGTYPGLTIEETQVLVDKVVQLYAASEPEKTQLTLGQFVMDTFYEQVWTGNVTIDRDFRGAQRTSDAETYLRAFLNRGRLDPKPLQDAVA